MNEFYPNIDAKVDPIAMAYLDLRNEFLARIEKKSPKGIIAMQIIDMPKIDEKYSDTGWKYGQLLLAQSFYDDQKNLWSCDPHFLIPMTEEARQSLVKSMINK